MPEEHWLPIPGYEGVYEVSDQFRVRRLARVTTHGGGEFTRALQARPLKTHRANGYLSVHLWQQPDGTRRSKVIYVEALVANLFGKTLGNPMMDEAGEEWRPIEKYEGCYEVSNLGRVRSLARYVNGRARRFARARTLVAGTGGAGYDKVELAFNGKTRTVSVHRLVAQAFVPNPLNLPIAHHKDENKSNNRSDNIEWSSAQRNVADWFDRRRIVVSVSTIEAIIAASKMGKSAAEILAALPRQRKTRK